MGKGDADIDAVQKRIIAKTSDKTKPNFLNMRHSFLSSSGGIKTQLEFVVNFNPIQ